MKDAVKYGGEVNPGCVGPTHPTSQEDSDVTPPVGDGVQDSTASTPDQAAIEQVLAALLWTSEGQDNYEEVPNLNI